MSSQPQQQQQQIVTSQQQQQQQQQQTFVATLSTVMPQRQQTATLIYSNVTNPQQQFTTATNQRLAVATPLLGQRPVRPIQIGNARLATGVRVSTANLSIRGPAIPVLAPSNVLSVNALQGRATQASNLTATTGGGLPATRIIQVQQPQSGGPSHVINAGRLSGNLMTLHPVIMNTSTTAGGGGVGGQRQVTTSKVQPSLTITHVGKLGNTGNASAIGQQQQHQSGGQPQIQLQSSSVGGPIGIVTSSQHQSQQQHQQQQQITQIVGLNQASGHQIVSIFKDYNCTCVSDTSIPLSTVQQIIGGPNIPVSGTVVPLSITSRVAAGSAANPSTGQLVTRNANVTTTTVLPIAKVLPQQTELVHGAATTSSSSNLTQQNVFLHTRSPNPSAVTSSTTTTFLPTTGGGFFYEPISTMSAGVTSSSGGGAVLSLSATPLATVSNHSSGPTTSVSYAPVGGTSSFAAVPTTSSTTTNRGVVVAQHQQQLQGMMPTQSSVPMRFNPQLLIDGSQQQPHQLQIHQQQSGSATATTHQIITVQQQQQQPAANSSIPATHKVTTSELNTTSHMVLPITAKGSATLANVTGAGANSSSAAVVTTSPRPTILRKRDSEG